MAVKSEVAKARREQLSCAWAKPRPEEWSGGDIPELRYENNSLYERYTPSIIECQLSRQPLPPNGLHYFR